MNMTKRCPLCGKEYPVDKMEFLYSIELSIKLMAMQKLIGENPDPIPELSCCKRRGISSLSVFCPDCKKQLDAEALTDDE